MPDELKPCPWCGHSAEMEPQGYRNEALAFCPKCSRGVTGECGDIDDAIAAWNTLPRAPKWTEYDGTEGTLPPEGVQVLIEISFPGHSGVVTFNTVGKRSSQTLSGSIWWEMLMADPWEIHEGNRWMPWPGDK